MQFAGFSLPNQLALAPMAGVTDLPFRRLCRRLGAGLTVAEMVSADSRLARSRKTLRRLDFSGEPPPRVVQIAGAEPGPLATAARLNAERGADVIDINLGCPAKKVCNRAAGSALLRDEPLVARILEAVVAASPVPVTLKMRTGWDPGHRNAVAVARLAEAAGVAALTVHGRTRACRFGGAAEYATIGEVKAAVAIPVLANGDIDGPEKARAVLAETGVDGLMIGRAAQGNPWVFRQIDFYLRTGSRAPEPAAEEIKAVLLGHLDALYRFYGEPMGVRIARKHLAWYVQGRPGAEAFRQQVNQVATALEQQRLMAGYLDEVAAPLGTAA